ncbi:MAG: CoA transferase [Polaromonas sp.]|nr:CoA transferase [Polaromonas sp.]
MSDSINATGVLSGLRVLDFGRYVAGPYCAALLADLGAEVIRIERPEGAEDRAMTPLAPDAGAMYLAVNRNKKSLTLNPKSELGKEILRRLLITADVVIANLPPKALKSLGIDFATLQLINRRAILTTVSAFGPGPWQEKPGFDGLGQAMSGVASLTGIDDQPTRAGVSWVDYGTATMAAMGTLAALMRREKTGLGEHVQCSLLHTALAFNNPALIEQDVLRNDRVPTLNRSHLAAPSDIFRTSDGWVMLYAVGDAMFRRWAKMIGEESVWLSDPRFKDDQSRGQNSLVISERMSQWTANRNSAEVLDLAESAGLPAAPVYSTRQVLDDSELLRACRAESLHYGSMQETFVTVPLPVTTRAASTKLISPPLLGEHTAQIMKDLGFTPESTSEAQTAGAI